MEQLDRGVVAGPAQGGGVLVSWRFLASDDRDIAFDVYRGGRKLTPQPLRGVSNFVDAEAPSGVDFGAYGVRVAGARSPLVRARAAPDGYIRIALQAPPSGVTPAGESYTYLAEEASLGDLDGDGDYEIILKWDPSNQKDNAFSGYTGNAYLDAYTLEGQRLWRIDMGRNIRAGSHYTQFLVFDFDGDGRAEVAARTSDGTIDGRGEAVGDTRADWREHDGETAQRDRTGAATAADGSMVARLRGRIIRGPEYLTVFDGRTGRALATAPYVPQRHPDTNAPDPAQREAVWGDAYANRSDRFLAAVAFLDGRRPSIVMARGYYGRSVLAAWDFRDGRLTQRWVFDSALPGNENYSGQGNHQVSVADVDEDGRDEIIYGAMAIDDDGRGLWSSRLHHGDALHVSDLDPARPGLERFAPHELPQRNGGIGTAMLDARTGGVLWTTPGERDVGRGIAMDIDPTHAGYEAWGTNNNNLYDARGAVIAPQRPEQLSFGVWWDGDLLRELFHHNQLFKWDWRTSMSSPVFTAEGVRATNGTKNTPVLSADLLGDWREEVIWRTDNLSELRIYVTPHPTPYGMTTLMHDPTYRLAIAWQNVAYNQPPHPGFFLGAGMDQARLRSRPESVQ